MKKIFILSSLIAVTLATPSFAEQTELDKKTVASKAYVDTKQNMIPATEEDYQNVLTDTNNDGVVGKMQIITADYTFSNDLLLEDLPGTIPTSDAVFSELDNYWQPKITTGNVMFHDDPEGTEGDIYVPGLVAYDSQTNALLSGNKIGILDQKTIGDDEGDLGGYSSGNGYGSEMDNFVPTVRAVAESLKNILNSLALKQNKLPGKFTSTTDAEKMGAKGGQTIELDTDGNIKRRYITAGGNVPLTLKSDADNVISYVNGTTSIVKFRSSNFGGNLSTTTANYIKGALVSLELLKDVYSALHNEIQNATPTGTPGNVAMYDASTGALGDGVATYSGATAQNPYNATNDAAKIATAAAVETKQTKRVCAGYEPGHENDPDYCWLWDLPD